MGSIGFLVIVAVLLIVAFSLRGKNKKKAADVMASAGNKVDEVKAGGVYAFVDDKGMLYIKETNRINVTEIPLNSIIGIDNVKTPEGYRLISIKTGNTAKNFPITTKAFDTVAEFIMKHVRAANS